MEPLMWLSVIAFVTSLIISCWQAAPILIEVVAPKGSRREGLTKWCNENWLAIRLQIFAGLMRIYYAICVSNDTLSSFFSTISIVMPILVYFVLDITLASNQINCILWWLPVPSCFVATVVCALTFFEDETRERFNGWTFVSSTFFSSFCGTAIILYKKKVMAPYPFLMPILQVADGLIFLICDLKMDGLGNVSKIYAMSSVIIGILAPIVQSVLVCYYDNNSAIIKSNKEGDAGDMVIIDMGNNKNSIGTPDEEVPAIEVEKETNIMNSPGTPNAIVSKMNGHGADEGNHSLNIIATSNEEEPAEMGGDEKKYIEGIHLKTYNKEEAAEIGGVEVEGKDMDASLQTSSSKEADMSGSDDGTDSTKSPQISGEDESLMEAKNRMDDVEISNADENMEM